MMENQVTTIEQSKRLLELGVPAENASMCWSEIYGERRLVMKVPGPYVVPAFTVADLLGMLPYKIEYERVDFYLSFNALGANAPIGISYESPELGDTFSFIDYKNNSLVNSICSCIEWLDENGMNLKL